MADSVGQIGLDLVVNQNQFKQQMAGIQGLAKKAGAALAAAFAVKKIIDFGAKCIELGSDLSEVQNVVDVTFPRMSKQVDDFAKNAITSFGLSETMAKKFTGTFGAMAKAFGFGEQAAYEMSTTLTGLAGDVASFYNISQDEAYTKLKSVFTGETETLKDLGIVMTQSALDSYALANGYGKVTAKMSEAEKGVLEYGEPVKVKGLNLLSAPGNDLVASTALAVSGAHMVLFTTGRGTPFASPVPTVKISSNSRLAGHKDNWIDFNAGRMVEDMTKEELAKELLDYVLAVASGRKVKSEKAGFHDMAIFKQGVTL